MAPPARVQRAVKSSESRSVCGRSATPWRRRAVTSAGRTYCQEPGGSLIGVERCRGGGAVEAKLTNATNEGMDRAQGGVAAAAVADGLAADTILLRGE